MGEQIEGAVRRMKSDEIMDRLSEINKLSFGLGKGLEELRDFFLGERPKVEAKVSQPRDNAGYFNQAKSSIEDTLDNLQEAHRRLMELAKETGISSKSSRE